MSAALLLSWLLYAPPAWCGPAFTLFPEPPRAGELVRCVTPVQALSAPRDSAGVLSRLAVGDTSRVLRRRMAAGIPWIETERGWAQAARLDRPAPAAGELLPGEEGMASGRILPWDWRPPDLRPVPDSLKAAGFEDVPMRLREGAVAAFADMIRAAEQDGVRIGILSGFRSASRQRRLYARAVERDPAQRASAAPGRSEHQLGTTADVATPGVPYFRAELARSPAGRWIERRAVEFGIVATLSRDRHAVRGTAHEPWHLRWVSDRTDHEDLW